MFFSLDSGGWILLVVTFLLIAIAGIFIVVTLTKSGYSRKDWLYFLLRLTISVLLASLGAPIVGYPFAMGICIIPGLSNSNMCGHNVYVWFILTIPLSFLIIAVLIFKQLKFIKKIL